MSMFFIAKRKQTGQPLFIKFGPGVSVLPVWSSPEKAVPYLTDISGMEDNTLEPLEISDWAALKEKMAYWPEQVFLHLMDRYTPADQ